MPSKTRKFFIKTFGCAMNVSDSERIPSYYLARGWKTAEGMNKADLVVINTCSVRQTAEDRVYGLVNKLAQSRTRRKKRKIILTGCMLHYPLADLKKKLPVVDEFRRIGDYFRLSSSKWQGGVSSPALVPISNGCNHFCSYCVVPFARGREKSRPFNEVVCEVEELARRGAGEIVLLGQNVNSYGKDIQDGKSLFPQLLRAVHRIKGIRKIKFLTSNPWDLTDELIEAMKLPKIDRYLHLPVQSGDDGILKKMNRRYTAKDYLRLVEKIRKEIPGIEIGTDIIVGFPGETKRAFQNTVNLCRKAKFIKAYIAKYSPRPGTAAYKLEDDVSPAEKKKRWQILDRLINKTGIRIRQK